VKRHTSPLPRYLRSGHKRVAGWLEPGAAEMIVAVASAQARAGISGNVAEIGVHRGRLFILLYLLSRPPEKAVAVDLFSLQHLNVDHSGEGDLAAFLRNMRKHADTERLVVHEGDSMALDGATLARLAGGSKFRLISIDGGHTREITMHDLATAEAALAEGGVIILDDFFSQFFPEVAEGTFRYFVEASRSIIPFAVGANKVLFCAPSRAEDYTSALMGLVDKWAWRNFLGGRVLCLNFQPISFAERFGKLRSWQSVKDFGPFKLARAVCRATFRAK
jgi:Methyltransferase domain